MNLALSLPLKREYPGDGCLKPIGVDGKRFESGDYTLNLPRRATEDTLQFHVGSNTAIGINEIDRHVGRSIGLDSIGARALLRKRR